MISILAIMPIVLELIRNCRDDSPSQKRLVKRIRIPGAFAQLRIARAVAREESLSDRRFRRERSWRMREVRDNARELTDLDCRQLIADADLS